MLNKVSLIGRAGKSPESTTTNGGTVITRVSIAMSEAYTDKTTGEKCENVEWANVSFFGKIAEIANQYITKGTLVYVEGSLSTNTYTDKKGIQRSSTQIKVAGYQGVLKLLARPQNQANDNQQTETQNQFNGGYQQAANHSNYENKGQFSNEFTPVDSEDDLPF